MTRKYKRMQEERTTKGITLIALVVTIIVLLILAGVTISAIVNENGIFKTAKKATDKTKTAQIEEQIDLAKFGSIDLKTGEIDGSKLSQLIDEIDGETGGGEVTAEYKEDEDKVVYKYYDYYLEQVVEKEVSVGRAVLQSEKEFEENVDNTLEVKDRNI